MKNIIFHKTQQILLNFREGLTTTMWDRWEVHGTADFTLQQFLQYFKVANIS